MKMKAGRDLQTGDTVLVNTGKGKSKRIVDQITDGDSGTLKVRFYTPSGRRPEVVVKPEQLVEVL